MLSQILAFLLDAAVTLVGGACLLRFAMVAQAVPFSQPVGRLVRTLSDWAVLPLRRLVKPTGRWDWASVLAAWLLVMAKMLVLVLLVAGAAPLAQAPAALPLAAVFGTLQLALSVATAVLLAYVVLSWVQPQSPLMGMLSRLVAPALGPLQRALPQPGGFDFSPLVALLVLHVAGIVLAGMQGRVLSFL